MLKIAVLLPAAYGGGTLRGALALVTQIHDGALSAGTPIHVEFGYVDGMGADKYSGFAALDARGIAYRPITMGLIPASTFNVPTSRVHWAAEVSDGPFIIFSDGVSNFDDVDYRIIVSDRLYGGHIAPTSKYSIVVYDFIQRYVPSILGEESDVSSAQHWLAITQAMRTYKYADAIFTTTDQTSRDAVAFGGARSDQVVKLPMCFDPIDTMQSTDFQENSVLEPYFIWTTNATPHKNHQVVLEGLEEFYRRNPGAPDTLITGRLTDLFDVDVELGPHYQLPYIKFIRGLIANSKILKNKLIVKGDLSDKEYVRLLAGAKLLLHGAIFDNGTFSVMEAAWYQVPSVSTRYSAMDEIASRFHLPLVFFDSATPSDLARALEDCFSGRVDLATQMPSREVLKQFSQDAQAPIVWKIISTVLQKSGVLLS